VKIEWLNEKMTEAIVTRGWWRWRTRAHVIQASDGDWMFVKTSAWAWDINRDLKFARAEAIKSSPWEPIRKLPRAKVVQP
jgi:hypothetical protein